ncbi:hypothetical protein ACFE04_012018 [Oxalis oulophora]
MRKPRQWCFTGVKKRFSFRRKSCKEITIPHSSNASELTVTRGRQPQISSAQLETVTQKYIRLATEESAAISIQATFRGHLVRRAFRGLRSLVKLQALVRGVRARKQTRTAMQCMDALVNLQIRVRARQQLSQYGAK